MVWSWVKWKKSEKGDGVGGVVLGEGGTALEGGGGKKCKCCSYRRGCVEEGGGGKKCK